MILPSVRPSGRGRRRLPPPHRGRGAAGRRPYSPCGPAVVQLRPENNVGAPRSLLPRIGGGRRGGRPRSARRTYSSALRALAKSPGPQMTEGMPDPDCSTCNRPRPDRRVQHPAPARKWPARIRRVRTGHCRGSVRDRQSAAHLSSFIRGACLPRSPFRSRRRRCGRRRRRSAGSHNRRGRSGR